MQENKKRLQQAVDIHLDSVNIHNDLGNELSSLLGYVETLALTEDEKERLNKQIDHCRGSLYEYLDYVIQYTFDNMNSIEKEENKNIIRKIFSF